MAAIQIGENAVFILKGPEFGLQPKQMNYSQYHQNHFSIIIYYLGWWGGRIKSYGSGNQRLKT
jgi:hypothetical protein